MVVHRDNIRDLPSDDEDRRNEQSVKEDLAMMTQLSKEMGNNDQPESPKLSDINTQLQMKSDVASEHITLPKNFDDRLCQNIELFSKPSNKNITCASPQNFMKAKDTLNSDLKGAHFDPMFSFDKSSKAKQQQRNEHKDEKIQSHISMINSFHSIENRHKRAKSEAVFDFKI